LDGLVHYFLKIFCLSAWPSPAHTNSHEIPLRAAI
jgi:hypothetical protein